MLVAAWLFLPLFGHGSELRETPLVKAVREARPSVVNIRGEKTIDVSSPQAAAGEGVRRVNGMGTGVVIDPRGYIVTNFHVVDGVRRIQVTTENQKQFIAKLVARDVATDLAVIKIDSPEELPMIRIGTSSDLMPGETVVAVGNAYGYEHTVTRGIISALKRSVQVSDAQYYADLIQTDASINPGNSGGPLLNIDGEMIGINVAVRAGAQGIGFAIPTDKAMAIVTKLIASHASKTAWHGLKLSHVPDDLEFGVIITSVAEDSPASECGLESGDRILGIDEFQIQRHLDFHRAMLERQPGEEMELRVERNGNSMEFQLTLSEAGRRIDTPAIPAWDTLGLELEPLSKEQFRQDHKTTRYRGGLVVTSVRAASPAESTGIRPGDVLVGMHIWETVSMENVSYILGRPDFGNLNPVKFYILRGSETLYGYLSAPTATARRPKARDTARHSTKN